MGRTEQEPQRSVVNSVDHETYSDLRERLHRAAKRVAPAWLRDQVDDIVQMALVKMMRSASVDCSGEVTESLLYRIVHSVVVDEIRRHKRRHETTIEPESPEPADTNEAASNPETVTEGQEIGQVIVQCLAELKPDKRRAVTLNLQGHSVPEIAKLLDFSRKKAENLVYRGLAELRAGLRKRGMEP